MHGEQQHVIGGAELDDAGAQHRIAGEVEGRRSFERRELGRFGLAIPRRQIGEVEHRQVDAQFRLYRLHGLAGLGRR